MSADQPQREGVVERLLQENVSQLFAYVRLHASEELRRLESLHDLVQSVCREVLVQAENFDYRSDAEFRAWLFKQALHKIINKSHFHNAQKRDARREVASLDNSRHAPIREAYATICTPSQHAIGHEEMERIERAFDTLPDEQREAIILKRLVGLDYDAIAAQLGRSNGAVRNLVHRGVARLALALEH